MINGLHVLDVRKNLVYVNLLCKGGIKMVFEADNFVLYENRVFVGKKHAWDGMFKLSITSSIDNTKNVSTYMIDSSFTLCHSYLAYLNFRSLKFMAKHGCITYNHGNHDKCEICI